MAMKYFGTDGIRGRVGQFPVTVEFVLRLGWAAGRVLTEAAGERVTVVIGKDTRISGYLLESALEAGLSAAGADVRLLGPMPTPAVAHLTHSLGAAAGIVISASHNPFEDNGIKFFSGRGNKLDDRLQEAIEAKLEEAVVEVAPERLGKATRIDDAVGRYVEFCKSTVTRGTSFDGLRVIIDCANGATYRIAPEVFAELGAEVVTIHDRPDGLNINRDCGSTHPSSLAERVVGERADLGIAFDGDGDRVIMVDDQGRTIDGDQILFILAMARHESGRLDGGVVGTVMSNFGLEEALSKHDIPFLRSPVGDRHVHQWLTERGWVLGGESSGHILCLDRTTTGCGIISALQVLEVVAVSGRSLADLAAGMSKCPQVMINVSTAGNGAFRLEDHAEIASEVRRVESELNGQGRVVLRPSGTEPVVRVTVEGHDADTVQRLAEGLAGSVERVLAS